MEVVFDSGIYIARSAYSEKDIPKGAGFRWDPASRHWWTKDPAAIAKVERYLSPAAKIAFSRVKEEREAALSDSRAAAADIEIPHPDGLDYLPFQKAGISYALRRSAALIGDEMGLGKTIQALGVVNADPEMRRILIVCPLSVALNWQREAEKWLVRPASIGVASAKDFSDTDVVIVHWGIVAKHTVPLRASPWDLIVLDEAHYAKNPKSARTKAVMGDYRAGLPPLDARRKLALTGTPIPNRPIELYPVVKWLAPAEFASWKSFATRYCGAYESRYGWDVTGSSHTEELQEKLRITVMVRRLKKDVMAELPPKTRQVVLIAADTVPLKKALKAEQIAAAQSAAVVAKAKAAVEIAKSADEDDYREAVAHLKSVSGVAFREISRARRETGAAKVPQVIEHVKDLLREEGKKIVLFAHHHVVIDQIQAALEADDKDWEGVKTVSVVGGMVHPAKRQAAIDAFQDDPAVRAFIGSIGAAKEGITLTAANHMVFAELDWVPGNLTQAEDRIHRIGQKDAVLIQHVILDGSLDAKMAQTIIEKQQVLDASLDAQHESNAELDYENDREEERGVEMMHETVGAVAATHSTTREQIAARAERVTAEDIVLVQAGLRQLAGLDEDFAQARNDAGFSKIDVQIGHDLAERGTLSQKQAALGAKLLAKYHRQLAPEVAGVWKALGERKQNTQPEPEPARTGPQRQVPAQPLPPTPTVARSKVEQLDLDRKPKSR